MADYPPTPSFGMTPNHAPQSLRSRSHREVYDCGDLAVDDTTLLDYHIAQSNTAFQHNASHIPVFSASSVASGIPPLPIYRDRSPPPYGYRQRSLPRGENGESRGSQKAYEIPLIQPYHELSPDVRPPQNQNFLSNKPDDQAAEEGELSEGEFEERVAEAEAEDEHIFEIDRPHSRPRDRRRLSVLRIANGQNRDRDQDSAPKAPLTDMYGRTLNLNRQRSESYSPYEPPNQVEYDQRGKRDTSVQRRNLTYLGHHEPSDWYKYDQNKVYKRRTPVGKMMASSSEPLGGISANQREPIPRQNLPLDTREDPNNATKTVADASKKAQSAILDLLPLNVRFDDYLEAGIDKEIVLRQFDSLGMAPTSLRPPNYNPQPASRLKDASHTFAFSEGTVMEQANLSNFEISPKKQEGLNTNALSEFTTTAALASSLNFTNHPNNSNIGEERKDRIARLLAEKRQKQPSAIQPDSPTMSASPEMAGFTKPAPSSQAVTKADKERQLRQKMEALQKSREQRAQRAAAKSATIQEPTAINKITTDLPHEPGYPSTTAATPASEHGQSLVPSKSASPMQLVSAQQMPSIPGLFLAAATNNPPGFINYDSDHGSTQKANLRKRPVASDFDEPQMNSVSHKRPFGQSRNEKPLVIDVSDEESDNEDLGSMELEQSQNGRALHGQPQNDRGTPKPKTARDLPPLSDFPPRKLFALPASATSTPPALQQTSKLPVRNPEDLQKKEKEIQDMKRRIAEAERRKRAKQNLSGSQTPASYDSNSSPAKSGNGVSVADKVNSIEIERLIESASRQVNEDQQKFAEARAAEQKEADELKQSEAEQRRKRRAKIASDLPVVDAKVENDQKKLADLRAELARTEAAVQQGLTEKRILAEEMAKLGLEVDDSLDIQREKLKEFQASDRVEKNVSDLVNDEGAATTAALGVIAQESSDRVQVPTGETASQAPVELGIGIDATLDVPDARFPPLVTSQLPVRSSSRNIKSSLGVSTLPIEDRISDQGEPNVITDELLKARIPTASRETKVEPQVDLDVDSEMVDSYAPDPIVLAPALTESSSKKGVPGKGLHRNNNESANIAEGESDTYEPPDATPSLSNSAVSPCSPPFSPAPPEGISNTGTDMQYNSLAVAINGSSEEPSSQVENTSRAAQQTDQAGNLDHNSTFYTPYESPLKNFHAYRFHPSYMQKVKGGFKSLTYSNKIDADQELCRYELAGGVCNDASCDFQHFGDMELADNVILVELGNSAGYSGEETPRWIIGLRTVLHGMRAKNTNDFEIIASEIIAYRANFLGDASRVLPLGGISV